MTASPSPFFQSGKIFLALGAIIVVQFVMIAFVLVNQMSAEKRLSEMNTKITAFETGGDQTTQNAEIQAQFNMLSSRLSALQADITQIKIRLQP
jgi:hypothetical protein